MDEEKKVCVFCGKPATTKDHVPPKGLFPKQRPELITVDSCEDCNCGTSKDDEYLRLILGARDYRKPNDSLGRVKPTIFRGLERPESSRMRSVFIDSIKDVDFITEMGIVFRTKAFKPDLPRLQACFNKIIRGLFAHEFGVLASPDKMTVFSKFMEDIDWSHKTLRDIRDAVKAGKEVIIDKEVFWYQFNSYENNHYASAWIMCFYKENYVFGITIPKENPV